MTPLDWLTAALVVSVFAIVTYWFCYDWKHGHRWIVLKDERSPYVEVARATVTASGIALAILATGPRSESVSGHEFKVAIVALVISVLFSVLFMLIQVRFYELALASDTEDGQGKISTLGLALIFVSGGIALAGFVVGFAYLAVVAFQMY